MLLQILSPFLSLSAEIQWQGKGGDEWQKRSHTGVSSHPKVQAPARAGINELASSEQESALTRSQAQELAARVPCSLRELWPQPLPHPASDRVIQFMLPAFSIGRHDPIFRGRQNTGF